MAKYTDAIRNVIIAAFNAGDQPTEAQFTNWITRIQEGIDEHDHSGVANGDGIADIGALDSITMSDDAWIGIGAALERIVFDAAGDISVMGANFGVGIAAPLDLVHLGSGMLRVQRSGAANQYLTLGDHDGIGAYLQMISPEASKKDLFIDTLHDDSGGPAGALYTYFRLGSAAAPTTVMTLRDDGTVTIPNLGGGGNQDVGADNAGLLYVPFVSDRKFKDNIEPLTSGLDVVRQLRGVTFNWNAKALAEVGLDFGECGQQVGLVAQEVAQAIPAATNQGKQYESYRKDTIIPYLIEAIKENDARLTQLEE